MKNIMRTYITLTFTFIILTATAQQQGQYSQYMMNYYLINPAAAGSDNLIDFRAGYRMQWVGLSGSPRNYYVSGHMPVNRLDAEGYGQRLKSNGFHVAGATFSGQHLGALEHNILSLTYGYHLPITRKWTVALGISAGLNQFSVNQNKLDFGDYIPDNAAGNINVINFDMGAGLWMYSDKIFLGLSSMQILQSPVDFAEGVSGDGMLNRLFFLTGGYRIKINSDYMVIPSVLFKQTLTALQIDINSKVRFRDFLWAGISYRRIDAMAVMAGIIVPLGEIKRGRKTDCSRLEIGYSYDLGSSKLRNHHSGTHEIMIALLLPKKNRLVCPSHFW